MIDGLLAIVAAGVAFAAIVPLGFMVGAALLPLLEDWGGWQAMFGASAVLVFVAGWLSLLLKPDTGPQPSVAGTVELGGGFA